MPTPIGGAARRSPLKEVAAEPPSGNEAARRAAAAKKRSGRKKQRREKNDPLFAFDTVREEYNWSRPKRKIKSVSRFDPTTTRETQSDCRIGEGFLCPRCSAVCTYDSRQCWRCLLECCYEAGVGVVMLQDRRMSYQPAKKRARPAGKKASAAKGRSGARARKKNMFADLKEKLRVAAAAAPSESESQQGGDDDGMASRVKEVTRKWTVSTIAEAKDGAYSTTHNKEDEAHIAEEAPKPPEPPSLEDATNCCKELKQQLVALQSKYDSIISDAIKEEEAFRDAVSKLEAAILERNKDSVAFSKTISSSSSKIEEIKKRVGSLTAERDEFAKTVEAKGLSSVPKSVPNYSTRIDALDAKMTQMRSECDDAKERVKDLMSGTEVYKQEKEKAAKRLAELETKHVETSAQCCAEIESLQRQLSDATEKISRMAAEKAELVENVSSTLIYVSGVRKTAERQAKKISELESSVESLTRQRDAALGSKSNKFNQ